MIVDGIQLPEHFVNLKGKRFGRIVVNNLKRNEKGKLVWECLCDCGNTKISTHSDIKAGDVNSCGCFQKESVGNLSKTHGLSKTPEYKAWKRIKSRVCNKNNVDFKKYSLLGMEEQWKDNFLIFLEHIGSCPSDGRRYSVDRINNNLGYFEGNVRWATDDEQSKNKSRYKNNKTNVSGVYYSKVSERHYCVATWYKLEKKQQSKYFSINKLGEELAFFMACEYREHQIMLLNLQGAGYSENHGKPKQVVKQEKK